MLDVFRHGEREAVETVCLLIFLLISLKKDHWSGLNEKGVTEALVWGPGSSDIEIKVSFEGKYKVSVFPVKWVLNTDRGFKAAS